VLLEAKRPASEAKQGQEASQRSETRPRGQPAKRNKAKRPASEAKQGQKNHNAKKAKFLRKKTFSPFTTQRNVKRKK